MAQVILYLPKSKRYYSEWQQRLYAWQIASSTPELPAHTRVLAPVVTEYRQYLSSRYTENASF